MRSGLAVVASCLLASLVSGCETFTYAFVNETGSPILVTVVDRERGGTPVPLAAGQQMVMRSPLTDVVRVEYGYDQVACRLDDATLRGGEASGRGGWRLIAIPPCETAGGKGD
mgnify:CR=1 FL=1